MNTPKTEGESPFTPDQEDRILQTLRDIAQEESEKLRKIRAYLDDIINLGFGSDLPPREEIFALIASLDPKLVPDTLEGKERAQRKAEIRTALLQLLAKVLEEPADYDAGSMPESMRMIPGDSDGEIELITEEDDEKGNASDSGSDSSPRLEDENIEAMLFGEEGVDEDPRT